MPTGRDGDLVCSALAGVGVYAQVVRDHDELLTEISRGAGALLIAEEALVGETIAMLEASLRSEPVWSDLPMVVFSGGRNSEDLLGILGSRFNATIVERPIRVTILISAVRGALRARQRQYEARDLLQRLEQADKQKDIFLATLSHELRTPLNSILGWIQIMRSRQLDEAAIERAFEVIERNAKGQAEMISDILFVSRIITGKLEIKHEHLDVSAVINTAVDMIMPAAEAKRLTVNVKTLEYDPVPVEGDAERLQQVFLNLLTNAVKFTPDGGTISVQLKLSGSNVMVCVRDTGQGINPQFLPHVFERFRQADDSYSRRIGGLGLGLAIVRHLVELHGGTVTAQSEGQDRGCSFTVVLPVADDRRFKTINRYDRESQISAEVLSKVNGMRILLVEDDKDSREMLEMVLAMHGVTVDSAESAADALAKLKRIKPDVLISDIGLPGDDGYGLIRNVRALSVSEGGTTPAIALTGYVSIQDRNLALDAGYQDHVPKPVNPNILLSLLAKLRNGKLTKTA